MAIRADIRFIGTGRPVTPYKNLFVNREPSRKGIVQSGVKSVSEFKNIVYNKQKPDLKTLGRKATALQKSLGISINVTI